MTPITLSNLRGAIERLNSISKKRYALHRENGKNFISVCANGKDTANGISIISCYGTKSEIWYILQAIIHYNDAELNDGYAPLKESQQQ